MLLVISIGASAKLGRAQTAIELDGSLPNGRTDNLVLTQPGPAYLIDQTMGEARGGNLFHSFKNLSVDTGDTASFSAFQPFDNVFVRVTGGNASVFHGVLQSTVLNGSGGGATFFLMNPSGILFGANSSIDVPGSLFLTTADELQFADGITLDLANAPAPVLSMSSPVAFGFLGGAEAADVVLTEDGTTGFGFLTLSMQPGETLGLVAGDVTLSGPGGFLFVAAPGGVVGLVATGSANAEVGIEFFDLRTAEPERLGRVALEPGASLSGSDIFDPNASQGEVFIRGARFSIETADMTFGGNLLSGQAAVDIDVYDSIETTAAGAIILANRGSQAGGAGILRAGRVLVDGAFSAIVSQNTGPGRGGDLQIQADDITVRDGGRIATLVDALTADPSGRGGDVVLSGSTLLLQGGQIRATANSLAAPGGLDLNVDDIQILGSQSIISSINTSSNIGGGNVSLGSGSGSGNGSIVFEDGARLVVQTTSNADGASLSLSANTIEILGGSRVETSTLASGNAGDIRVSAGRLSIGSSTTGLAPGLLASAVDTGAAGRGGTITVDVETLDLRNGGQITTTTRGSDAGDITVTATGDVMLVGDDGLSAPSGLFARAESGATGLSGDVLVDARNISIEDGATISTRSLGLGDSGAVTLIAAGELVIRGSGIAVSTITSRGNGGDITLEADQITLSDGGAVDVTADDGLGGALIVRATNLTITGRSSDGSVASQLSAQSQGGGTAGGVSIGLEGDLRMNHGGLISARSNLIGPAGDIALRARDVHLSSGAAIEARALGSADAGSINIMLRGDLNMRNADITTESALASGGQIEIVTGGFSELFESTISSSVGDGTMNGGDVAVVSPIVVLNDSQIIAQAVGGNGGNILIDTNLAVFSATSQIDASSQLGIDGRISQTVPNTDLSGQLAVLDQKFSNAADQLQRNCSARTERAGSFVVNSEPVQGDPDGEYLDFEDGPTDSSTRGPCARH